MLFINHKHLKQCPFFVRKTYYHQLIFQKARLKDFKYYHFLCLSFPRAVFKFKKSWIKSSLRISLNQNFLFSIHLFFYLSCLLMFLIILFLLLIYPFAIQDSYYHSNQFLLIPSTISIFYFLLINSYELVLIRQSFIYRSLPFFCMPQLILLVLFAFLISLPLSFLLLLNDVSFLTKCHLLYYHHHHHLLIIMLKVFLFHHLMILPQFLQFVIIFMVQSLIF